MAPALKVFPLFMCNKLGRLLTGIFSFDRLTIDWVAWFIVYFQHYSSSSKFLVNTVTTYDWIDCQLRSFIRSSFVRICTMSDKHGQI
jgi:hypothetical protein